MFSLSLGCISITSQRPLHLCDCFLSRELCACPVPPASVSHNTASRTAFTSNAVYPKQPTPDLSWTPDLWSMLYYSYFCATASVALRSELKTERPSSPGETSQFRAVNVPFASEAVLEERRWTVFLRPRMWRGQPVRCLSRRE